jgi:hypothetical protein
MATTYKSRIRKYFGGVVVPPIPSGPAVGDDDERMPISLDRTIFHPRHL